MRRTSPCATACAAQRGPGAVKKVLSKHEALVQCSAYLAAHDIETEAYSNTAAAAKFIAETRPEGVGAVCSAQAAEEYGLEIIAADIQNTDNNCTRFIVISREAVLPEDAEKISLCFSLPHTRARCAIRWSVSLCSA